MSRMQHSSLLLATVRALVASPVLLLQTPAPAQDAPLKAVVAIVGEVDAFNIGQEGFCGARTDVQSPSGSKFKIPANQQTYFFVRSKFQTTSFGYTCEGDFSFVPEPTSTSHSPSLLETSAASFVGL